MKKIIALVLVVFSLVSCTQQKIAYVDIQEIMKEYKGTKETEESIKVRSESLKAELDSLISSFQLKVQTYQQGAAKMSAKSRNEKEQALMQEEQIIRQRQQNIQQQLQNEGSESVKEITKEIDSFVKGYAKTNGYHLILGTSDDTKAVLYAEDQADITEDVLLQLNKAYKSKK